MNPPMAGHPIVEKRVGGTGSKERGWGCGFFKRKDVSPPKNDGATKKKREITEAGKEKINYSPGAQKRVRRRCA